MAIVMVLRVGPLKSEDLWEVWVNITEPVSQAVVRSWPGSQTIWSILSATAAGLNGPSKAPTHSRVSHAR